MVQVTWDNKVYNVYLDRNGEEQRRYVGDIRDVGTFKVKDMGGISVERLQRASRGRFDGTITAFPDDNTDIPLPPNAPLYRKKVWRHLDHADRAAQNVSCDALECHNVHRPSLMVVLGERVWLRAVPGGHASDQGCMQGHWKPGACRMEKFRGLRRSRRGTYSWRGRRRYGPLAATRMTLADPSSVAMAELKCPAAASDWNLH